MCTLKYVGISLKETGEEQSFTNLQPVISGGKLLMLPSDWGTHSESEIFTSFMIHSLRLKLTLRQENQEASKEKMV